MHEDQPGRWLAIWPTRAKIKHYKWQMPYIGVVQNGRFYHGGGISHMPFSSEDEVVKDYGTMTLDEWEKQGGDNQWYVDFPPVSSPAEEYSVSTESWIAPDGTIYLCSHEGHEALALRLCKKFSIVDPKDYLSRDGDLLEDRGWLRVYWNEVRVWPLDDLSQKQIDSLFDILMVLERKREAEDLCESIRTLLDIKPKQSFSEEKKEVAENSEDLNKARSELLNVIVEATSKPEPEQEKNVAPEKPFVLREQQYVEIVVRAYCTKEDLGNGRMRGISCFKIFCTEVSDDNDKVYGQIGGGTGYVTLSDRRRDGMDRNEFFIPHTDLWYAYQKALNKKFGTNFPESEEIEFPNNPKGKGIDIPISSG